MLLMSIHIWLFLDNVTHIDEIRVLKVIHLFIQIVNIY